MLRSLIASISIIVRYIRYNFTGWGGFKNIRKSEGCYGKQLFYTLSSIASGNATRKKNMESAYFFILKMPLPHPRLSYNLSLPVVAKNKRPEYKLVGMILTCFVYLWFPLQ